MSKKRSMVLGYTRADLPVLLPTRDAPDTNSSTATAMFADWTRGDHVDASRILIEHGEREADSKVGSWCVHWARAHRAIGKFRKAVRVRGAAETSLRPNRLR